VLDLSKLTSEGEGDDMDVRRTVTLVSGGMIAFIVATWLDQPPIPSLLLFVGAAVLLGLLEWFGNKNEIWDRGGKLWLWFLFAGVVSPLIAAGIVICLIIVAAIGIAMILCLIGMVLFTNCWEKSELHKILSAKI
jgi:hypothetical protein